MKDRKLFGSLMLFIATLMWGLSYSIQSISSENLGTFTVVFFKGLGGLALLPMLIAKKHRFSLNEILSGMAIGTSAFLGCIFQQLGIENSTISKASFITTLYIIFVPLIEWISGKKISRKILISVAVALLGLYFLCFSGTETFGIGDFYLLICSIFFALQIILIDKYTRIYDPLAMTFLAQITVSLYSGILMLVLEKPTIEAISTSIVPILYMVFISGALAQSFQIIFQRDVGASLSSLIMSFESVFGAIFGWIVLSQSLSLKEIFGCILVFIAILIAES
ncbi:MAG: DMT family transporter [Erysipelotrichaceae bacterium]|nr:DMT family transporter [Erysipelotrichaceae bacterium]